MNNQKPKQPAPKNPPPQTPAGQRVAANKPKTKAEARVAFRGLFAK